jgi:hypothetical protein
MAFLVSVPNVAGVPPVNFAPDFTSVATTLLTADTFDIFGLFGTQWGIYLDGVPVIVADTVIAFDYRQDWTIADYPLEEGSFESYDKVATPFDTRFQFIAGGGAANRQALLDSIAAIAGDLNIYDVVTPDSIYPSVNVKHYDYRRTTTRGLGLITVDVWCTEIRVATASFGSTASPTSAPNVDGGQVQPTAPTSTQTTVLPTVKSVGFQ